VLGDAASEIAENLR